MKKQIFAIDFDGTIVEHAFPKIGKLKKNAKEVINKLHDDGHTIIIWTCRSNDWMGDKALEAIKFLDENGIHYDAINENYGLGAEFNPKPKIYYDILIDDKSLLMNDDVDWHEIEIVLIERNIL